jgi:hypothetical protein
MLDGDYIVAPKGSTGTTAVWGTMPRHDRKLHATLDYPFVDMHAAQEHCAEELPCPRHGKIGHLAALLAYAIGKDQPCPAIASLSPERAHLDRASS